MRKYLYAIFIVFLAGAFLYAGDYQVGIIAGSPVGISGKWWLTEKRAITAHVGVMDERVIQVSHIWKRTRLPGNLQKLKKYLDYYYVGAGGAVKNGQKDRVGARFSAGFAKDFTAWFSLPLSFSLEVAPVFRLSPSYGINIDGGLLLEYRF